MLKIRVQGLLLPFIKQKSKQYQQPAELPAPKEPASPEKLLGQYLLAFYLLMIILFSLMAIMSTYAQAPAASLQPGDPVPETFWQQSLQLPDGNSQTTTLATCKGKLILLDFWATWCSPCIAMMPKMDSLQKAFEGKVQFIPVTYQSETEVYPFLQKLQERIQRKLNLPEITGDTVLKKLFPHTALPHYAWIGPDGTVQAITELGAITADNISRAIAGKEIAARFKQDQAEIPNDYRKPMLIGGNAGDGRNLLYHSVLTSYTEGLPLMSAVKKDSTTIKIVAYNATLFGLYRLAYSVGVTQFNNTNTIFEVADKSRLTSSAFGLEYLDYLRSGNGYCYELIVPLKWTDRVHRMMQEELKKLFPYTAAVEQREKRCYALRQIKAAPALQSKGGKPSFEADRFGLRMVNRSLDYLIMRLRVSFMQRSALPLVNQTDYHGNADLGLQADLTDIASVNKALEKYGLKFIESTTQVPVLVIRDAKESSNDPSYNVK